METIAVTTDLLNPSHYDQLNLFVALAGAVFALISVVFAWIAVLQSRRARHYQQQIADAEGVFQRATLNVSFCKYKEGRFVALLPIKERTSYAIPTEISVTNTGLKTASDIEVFYRANKALFFDGAEPEVTGPAFKGFKVHKIQESKDTATYGFTLTTLHPGQSATLKFPLLLNSATMLEQVGQPAFSINIMATQSNQPTPVGAPFTLEIMDATHPSPIESVATYNQKILALKRPKTKEAFWKRLKSMFHPVPVYDTYVLLVPDFATSETRKTKSGTLVTIHSASCCSGIKLPSGFWFPALYPDSSSMDASFRQVASD